MEATKTAAGFSWIPRKGIVWAFIVGVIVGPMLTSSIGLTVTSRSAGANLHAGVIDLQASLCDARARAEVRDPEKLDSNARRTLAEKFSPAQASGSVDYEIVGLCSAKLAG